MILKDSLGELEARIADDFSYQGCILSIVCPDSKASEIFGKPVICVRLRSGIFKDEEGKQFQIEEGKNPPLFIFDAALVANCIRKSLRVGPQPSAHPAEFDALEPSSLEKPAAKSSRAKPEKKGLLEAQESLF